MSEEFKATVRRGPPHPPDDPNFRKAIHDGLNTMWDIQGIINRKLAEQGLTINDVGCVTYDPKTGEITIHKGYFGP